MAILDGFLFFGSKTKTDTFAKGGNVSAFPRLTEVNKKHATNDFLSLAKCDNFQGEYDFTPDGGLQLEWGKYGYSVSESKQEDDYVCLARAANEFNQQNKLKLYAIAEHSDKYNTVRIMDMVQLGANEYRLTDLAESKSKLDLETYKAIAKAGIGNKAVEQKLKAKAEKEENANKSLAAALAAAQKATGYSFDQRYFETISKLFRPGPVLYSNYEVIFDRKKVKFETLELLFDFLKSEDFIKAFWYNAPAKTEAVIYLKTDYYKIFTQKDYSKENTVSLVSGYSLIAEQVPSGELKKLIREEVIRFEAVYMFLKNKELKAKEVAEAERKKREKEENYTPAEVKKIIELVVKKSKGEISKETAEEFLDISVKKDYGTDYERSASDLIEFINNYD